MHLSMARSAIRSICKRKPTQRSERSTSCHLKWPVMCPVRLAQPTKPCGRKSSRMQHNASRARPRNAIRDWIKPRSTFPPRSPTISNTTTPFKEKHQVSVLTLDGRVIVPYTGYEKHTALIQHGATIGAAKLWYDKPRKQFYLLVSLEIEGADPTPQDHTMVVGVDVGTRYLAVTATTTGKTSFHSGKAVGSTANHYARLRKRLQRKGTRSATKRLIAISGRERRLKLQTNHSIAKRIIAQHPHSIIGLENLTDIGERTKRRKGKKASQKQRKANAAYSKWAFAELHGMLAYKAVLAGSMTVKVDAHFTSQACPMCGFTSKANRPKKGLLFVCQSCHYTLHADLVGARNVAMRTLLIRQDWMSTGQLSVAPDVSNDKAKAARLHKYAELRWSSEASSGL